MVARASKPTILVAEDDPRMMRLVQRNLELAGYRVLTAGDGQQALQVAEAEPCSLLVLDVMMPILDGLEVCRRVREFSSVKAQEGLFDLDLELDAEGRLLLPYGGRLLPAGPKEWVYSARSICSSIEKSFRTKRSSIKRISKSPPRSNLVR